METGNKSADALRLWSNAWREFDKTGKNKPETFEEVIKPFIKMEEQEKMKFDFEKGKQGLVEYFNSDFDRATEYSLEYIKSCNDIDDIENEIYSFRAFKEEHLKIIGRIIRANTLSSVFEALEDVDLEEFADETILSFFIEGLQ